MPSAILYLLHGHLGTADTVQLARLLDMQVEEPANWVWWSSLMLTPNAYCCTIDIHNIRNGVLANALPYISMC